MEASAKVLSLVQARSAREGYPIENLFSPKEIETLKKLNSKYEGNTEKQKNPFPANQLSYAAWVIARMGGWHVYNKKRPPGPVVMVRGMKKFMDLMDLLPFFLDDG